LTRIPRSQTRRRRSCRQERTLHFAKCNGTSYQGAGEKMAARDNDVPGDVLKQLGEDDFRMTQLIKKDI